MSNLLKAKLRDNNKEVEMSENGYCYFPNFLDASVLSELQELFYNAHKGNENDKGMWNSLFDIDKTNSRELSAEILRKLKPKLDSLFESYAAPVASFMSKNAGEAGVCEFHRDFSILDEEVFEYRNVWIPLVDVKKENGALYAHKGSHKVFNYPLPMFEKWPYTYLQDDLFKEAEIFEVNAGDLIIYADRTLHGSYLNKSDAVRPVIHLGALHPEYKIAYYHLNEEVVSVYDVPFEFYFQNNFGNVDGKFPLIKQFKYEPPKI